MVKVGVSPEVNALATILLILSLVMVVASQLIARDGTKAHPNGPDYCSRFGPRPGPATTIAC
nr:spermidine/putrescine ABC transporter membrane protein [Raoultella sp. NCTC 9187]